jgi:hypothetical protein
VSHANRHFPVGRPAGPSRRSLRDVHRSREACGDHWCAAPVAISVEPGSPFEAFNGALTGATLQIIPQRLVIQSWRSIKFNDGDPVSTLILAFTPEGTNGRIDLVHLDVPAHNYQSVVEGWETHYWGPWRRYLAG